ncbi:MAG: hypothetical protein JXM73_25620 [Anaerolineae bacterium]|nr:hypothetical protein [Anaerolineae bacterium]
MESENTRLPLRCAQCGADLNIGAGEVFVACAHCTSALYLDRSEVVLHYLVARTLDAQAATDTLKRWMAGPRTAKDLDRLAMIEPPQLRYLPLWRFRIVDDGSSTTSLGEQVHVEPATEADPWLQELTLPPGELRFFRDPSLAPLLLQPTISYETVESPIPASREVALVHVPLFFFQYRFHDETYRAAVDAASGQVLAAAYPARQDLAYRILGFVTCAAFFLAAFGLYWLLYVTGEKLVPALALRCGLQLLLTALLFFPAWLVARKF